jgi:hypothetical protein
MLTTGSGQSGPHAEALYYHIAQSSLDSARSEADECARRERIATAIVFAALCLEAFINQEFVAHLEAVVADESEQIQLETKWLILPLLLGASATFGKGSEPFQTFHDLVRTRNGRLVHFKPAREQKMASGTSKDEQWSDLVGNLGRAEKYVACVPAMIQELNRLTNGKTATPEFLQGQKYIHRVWASSTVPSESR